MDLIEAEDIEKRWQENTELCKKMEENCRMGKIRDGFKKIRYQGNISCKDGHNKGQKWYEPIRRRD